MDDDDEEDDQEGEEEEGRNEAGVPEDSRRQTPLPGAEEEADVVNSLREAHRVSGGPGRAGGRHTYTWLLNGHVHMGALWRGYRRAGGLHTHS